MDACPKFSWFGIDREYSIRDHANPDDIPILDDFFKKMLDELYDGVYFVDTDRRLPYWNAAAERLSGYVASSSRAAARFRIPRTTPEMEGQAVDQLIRPSHGLDSGGEQTYEPVRSGSWGRLIGLELNAAVNMFDRASPFPRLWYRQ